MKPLCEIEKVEEAVLVFSEKTGLEDVEEKLESMEKKHESSKLREEELGIFNKLYEEKPIT